MGERIVCPAHGHKRRPRMLPGYEGAPSRWGALHQASMGKLPCQRAFVWSV